MRADPLKASIVHRRSRALALALACLSMAVVAAAQAASVRISPAGDARQAGMREIRELAPDIALDIRYAGNDNFTGRPVPGYDAGKCYLLAPVATALAGVQKHLRAQGYSLQVFDCYRPARSVKAFVAWVGSPDDPQAKAVHYPDVDKRTLLDGYIAETSGHSRGATIDLTLLDCRQGPCVPLDMGTGFDYFDPRAHTDAPGLTAAQAGNRQRLLQAMQAGGFANYPLEWWHYTLRPEPAADVAYDFPVR